MTEMENSKLYPRYATFATVKEAAQRAQEMEGYAELWRIIAWLDQAGVISVN